MFLHWNSGIPSVIRIEKFELLMINSKIDRLNNLFLL